MFNMVKEVRGWKAAAAAVFMPPVALLSLTNVQKQRQTFSHRSFLLVCSLTQQQTNYYKKVFQSNIVVCDFHMNGIIWLHLLANAPTWRPGLANFHSCYAIFLYLQIFPQYK